MRFSNVGPIIRASFDFLHVFNLVKAKAQLSYANHAIFFFFLIVEIKIEALGFGWGGSKLSDLCGEKMSNLRTICRPYTVFSSIICCRQRQRARPRVSLPNPNYRPQFSSPWFDSLGLNSNGAEPWFRVNQRRTMVHASNWSDQKSPYETLGIYFSFFFSSSL